ncbi:MAG: response regulator, partial [Desulfobulbaceae bacterium]|nr:response regulator [Desulfobulbaceae bacterium]
DIDAALASLRQDMLRELYHRAAITVVLILLALALCYKISLLLSKRLTRELELFSNFFKQAAANPERMDADRISITEFSNLARAANQMIDERQKIHADLQQAKEVWEKSFNAISDLVTIQDKDGRIIRANSAACNLLGLQPGEIVGKRCHDVFQHSPSRCPNCPGQKTARDGHTHTSTIPFADLQKTFQISTAPTFDDQGQLEYIVHVAKDISEQKRLEEELVQSRKMEAIGTLAGGIAHDFNNILTSLLGYADLAQEEIQNNGRPLHYIEQVITAGTRAGNLVKQILAFSRKSEHVIAHISPERTVREALQLLRASIPSTVKMQEEIANIDATILADSTKIHQVVVNLCTNALHSMENQQGSLAIRLARTELTAPDIRDQSEVQPGPFMELSVADTGHGIAPGIIDHIFDPYFTTKEVGKGIGMGLAVVHGIIKEHGGLITVESTIGRGTTFRVYLPLSTAKIVPEPAPAALPLPIGNERILLIDDEEAIIRMLKGGLERFGYRITAMTSSTEALAAITADPDQFDLVITDQTMPDLSGINLAREILALRPSLPVILYTGYSDLASDILAKQSGIREFLLKPIDSRTMAGHIRRILDGNRPPSADGAGHTA